MGSPQCNENGECGRAENYAERLKGSEAAMPDYHIPPDSRLADYLGTMVTVYYNPSTYSDNGRVTYLDASWLELTKDNGERLLIPVEAIRLVKMLETHKPTDADILLRPADGKNDTRLIKK
jgi:hypothetical protein